MYILGDIPQPNRGGTGACSLGRLPGGSICGPIKGEEESSR